jgi:hypothetical protein
MLTSCSCSVVVRTQVPISQGSREGFDDDEVEMLWQWRTSYRGAGPERRVLLSMRLPDDTRHNFEMEAEVARDLAAALVERADAEDPPTDSAV